MGIKNYQTNP